MIRAQAGGISVVVPLIARGLMTTRA